MLRHSVFLALTLLSSWLVSCSDDESSGSEGTDEDVGGATGATTASNATRTTNGEAVSAGTRGTLGGADDDNCMTPPDAPKQVGWASEAGGTQGGGDLAPTVVSSTSAFAAAVAGSAARVVHVNGSLSGTFNIGSNKTIVGVCGAELHGSVRINGQQNIILRNLAVIGNDCSDSPDDCSAGADAINVTASHHLWFDHLDVSDGSDGNLDMTHASDYITISWSKFSYSTARSDPDAGASGHRFSNLIGASDTDAGDYRITFHHDWWADNVDQRMPRSRFGDIHVFNNLFTSSGNRYCTNAGISTHLLVENNIYRGVNNPLSPDGNGDMRAKGNVFEDTSGNQSDNGGVGFDPPYGYTLDPTDGLDALIQAEAGPHDRIMP